MKQYRLLEICSIDLDRNNLKLGGPGKIIEIDESLYAKVKHSRGISGKCYMQVVPDRKGPTLLSVKYDRCLARSIIYSDCWSSYNKTSKLRDYKHQTVNHTYNFLGPDTGTCINRIGSLWNASKHRFKEMRGCKRAFIQSYLDEFMRRLNNQVHSDKIACYNLILVSLAKFYKPGTSGKYLDQIYL